MRRGFKLLVLLKKKGGHHPVLDLRRLNKYIYCLSFRVVTLASIAPISRLVHGCQLAGSFHISIHLAHWTDLRFTVGPNHDQYQVLSFELLTASRVFTNSLATGMAQNPNLGNWLIRGRSQEKIESALDHLLSLFSHLGLLVNYKKLSFTIDNVDRSANQLQFTSGVSAGGQVLVPLDN